MDFDMRGYVPTLNVWTYSTYYNKYSYKIAEYARWHREREQPNMSDEEFNAADHFTINLTNFKKRFGEPK